MSTNSRFDQFITNINLTVPQDADARTKIYGVSSKLHSAFYPGTTYDGATSLVFGSYAKGTNVRPARDVDVLFKLPIREFGSSTTYNFQSALLQKVKGILLEKYPDTDVRGDGPVVVVNFSNHHFVEVLPAFEVEGKFLIPYTSGGGSWKVNDPLAEIRDINSSNIRSNGNTKNLIKMMKKWQHVCAVPIKTLAIERRAVNFLASYEHFDKTSVYYDWMVRDYFKELIAKADSSCELPGLSEKINYGSAWKSKAESAYQRAIKACEYEFAKDEVSAALEWKKIFGEDYWL